MQAKSQTFSQKQSMSGMGTGRYASKPLCSPIVWYICHSAPDAHFCYTAQVAPLPKDLQDRRVEITGPVDRKMVINAMNCGASVFMADFEDSNAPVW